MSDYVGFPGGAVVKNLPADAGNTRDVGLIPGLGRSSGGGNGHPLQYSCLKNPMNGGAWKATVHGLTKSWTRLKQLNTPSSTHTHIDKIIPTCWEEYTFTG